MVKKVILILLIAICFMIYLSSPAYALDSIFRVAEEFATEEPGDSSAIDKEGLQKTNEYLFHILFVIGVVLAVAVGIIIGIQFVFGSVQDQAKVKEVLVPYIVGVFVVFSAFGIWRIVVGIGNDVAPVGTQTTAPARPGRPDRPGNPIDEIN